MKALLFLVTEKSGYTVVLSGSECTCGREFVFAFAEENLLTKCPIRRATLVLSQGLIPTTAKGI